MWAQCWVSVSLQAFTEHFSNDSRFSDTQCNVSHVISNLLLPIIITTILFSHLAVHWKNSVPYDICGGKSGQNWEKYLWENLFVPFQSCLWSDCHIDRLQILIGNNFSPMTRWQGKAGKCSLYLFRPLGAGISGTACCCQTRHEAPNRCASNLWEVQCTTAVWRLTQTSEVQSNALWSSQCGEIDSVQCSWRSAVCSGGQRWLCKCIGSTQSCDLWVQIRALCLFTPVVVLWMVSRWARCERFFLPWLHFWQS